MCVAWKSMDCIVSCRNFNSYALLWLRIASAGLYCFCLGTEKHFVPLPHQKGTTSTWTPINSPCIHSSSLRVPVSKCFWNDRELSNRTGLCIFPMPTLLALLCPVKCIILKSPTGHLFARMFLAVLHPSCPKIEYALRSKTILRCFLRWTLTKRLKSLETGKDRVKGEGVCKILRKLQKIFYPHNALEVTKAAATAETGFPWELSFLGPGMNGCFTVL